MYQSQRRNNLDHQNIRDILHTSNKYRAIYDTARWNQVSTKDQETFERAVRIWDESYRKRMNRNIQTKVTKPGKKREIFFNLCDWIWCIICIIGMLYQTYNTSDVYLQYDMTSEVLMQLQYEFDTPALGLCFNPVAFREDGICPRNVSFAAMRKCYAERIEYDMNLNQIMGELSEDLISRVTNPDDKYEVETFFKWRACLDINMENIHTNLANVTKGNAPARRIFVVEVNLAGTFNGEFSVHLHDPNISPRGIGIKTLDLLFDNNVRNAYQVGYQGIEINLLPYPFKDACIDYTDSEYESHFHCLDDCVNEKLYSKYGKYHPYLLFTSDEYREDIRFINISEINYSQYFDSCEHQCPDNCTTKTYNVITVDNWLGNFPDIMTIAVDYLENNIFITYQERFTFEEFIIYVGSILSLWFGWCIHVTPIHVIQSVRSIKYRGKN